MNVIKLSNESLLNIYKEKLVHEFHEEEIKPYETIKRLVKENKYIGYGLYEGDELASYAFFCKCENGKYILLDYYVVDKKFRSKGYGSKFLNILKEKNKNYKGMIGEIEDPDFAENDKDLNYRLKRIKFYEKNNSHHTNIKSSVFGAKYIIMILSETSIKDDVIEKELDCIYKEILGEENTKNHVDIVNVLR